MIFFGLSTIVLLIVWAFEICDIRSDFQREKKSTFPHLCYGRADKLHDSSVTRTKRCEIEQPVFTQLQLNRFDIKM